MDRKNKSKKKSELDCPTEPVPVIKEEDLKPQGTEKKLYYDNRDTEPLFFTEVLPEIPRKTKKRVTWKESGALVSEKAASSENLILFRKEKKTKK